MPQGYSFAKLKDLLTPTTTDEQDPQDTSQENEQSMDDEYEGAKKEAIRRQNQKMNDTMFGAAKKALTGEEMTPDEQEEASNSKKMVDQAGNNVAGFAGSIGEAGSVSPEVQALIDSMKSGDPQAAQQLQNMYKATADSGATKFNPAVNYALDKKIGNSVSTEMPNASNQAYNQMSDTNFQKLKDLLSQSTPTTVKPSYNPPTSAPLTEDQLSKALARKLTGGY